MALRDAASQILDTLRREPRDDASWQVLADALAERADVRAEVIRLERRRDVAGPPERDALALALTKLTKKHQRSWQRGLPTGVTVARWSRGFVDTIAVRADERAPELLASALGSEACVLTTGLQLLKLRKKRASGDDGDDDDFDEDEDDDFDDDDEAPVIGISWLASVDLTPITALDLSYLNVQGPGAEVVASHPVLPQLRQLDLRYAGLDGDALAALLARPLPKLERLWLQGNELGSKGGAALAAATLPALRELDLRYARLGDEGAEQLSKASALTQLSALRLYREDLGTRGAAQLASSSLLPKRLRAPFLGRTP